MQPTLHLKRWFKEPLLHFLLIGAVLFAVNAWWSGWRAEAGATASIQVTAAVIERLRAGYERQFGRKPDEVELRGLVAAHIREEVLCREALALGLDRDDTIVRRRLAQKMEFLAQDVMTSVAPDEATLAAFFARNANRYAKPAQASFRHVYFSKEKRGAKLEADVNAALAALAKPAANEEAFGDSFLQGFEFSDRNEQDLASIFGPEFGLAVMRAPTGRWTGPIASSYGLHLVYVSQRGASQPVELAAVREMVLRDYFEERRQTGNAEVLARMKQNYHVVIDEVALKAAVAAQAETASSGQ